MLSFCFLIVVPLLHLSTVLKPTYQNLLLIVQEMREFDCLLLPLLCDLKNIL
ncbi:hypothetical protein VMF7928_02537 [Vibrio marisflavi CECT 7928]|uniref:Uncharacterized protein n=1 Tax=Vibrio marisflavi CECT 7928 TaxID=634439 RepID=A0ABN8E6F4_9VIBR|nr:hypothetical protein VMF7928_02537 [Vibrio marisflavi CECT 7928]